MRFIILISAAIALLPIHAGFAQEKLYTPEGGVRPSKDRVEIENLRLLASQDAFDRNIAVQKLADFARDVQKSVSQSVPADAPGFGLLVKVILSSDNKPKYDISSDGKATDDLLQAIYDRLQKLSDVRTKADSLPFEIHFKIKPKT